MTKVGYREIKRVDRYSKRGGSKPMWRVSRSNHNIVNIPLDEIQPNIYQPRKDFDDESNELDGFHQELWYLQPIVVRRTGRTGYEIIAGSVAGGHVKGGAQRNTSNQ